ncbi:MAG TPA: MBL fold metallo-hydrolase [Bryobacteraceae bacterium]|jgi:glyoxylase-like metal-dependent hydrolase (beta-lactamase superfamily II)
MNRTLLLRLSLGIVFLSGGWMAYTQNQGGPPQLNVNKVKDDLYEIEGDGGNVAVYITNEGLILVDDKFDRDHEAIVEKVKGVSNQPIKYVLSTHYHEDHSGGNAKMLAMNVEVISTANARKNIVNKVQSNAGITPMPARVVFTEETSVFLGGKEVRAHHFGRGHTNGDAVIYFPADRTIHTGDLMAGNTPLIDYPGGGSLVEWTKTLDGAMNGFDFDTVIPGHGPVTNKAGLKKYRDDVEKLRNRAAELVRQGSSREQLATAMQKEFNWAPTGLQMQWSIPGMLTELK